MIEGKVKYKKTGLDWMHEVPEHWEVLRLKDITLINQQTLSENSDDELIIRYIDIGNVNSDGVISEIQEFRLKDAPSRARRIVKTGDIIISTVRTYLKAITQIDFSTNNHIASTGFAVLSPNYKILSDFLRYAVRAKYFIDCIMANSFGVSYPAINSSTLGTLKLVLPPKSEQDQIVQYIKAQEEKINLFIQKKKRFIELLKEQRQRIITHAATKGTNEKVNLKQTGIDGLNQIPDHWEVRRLKNVSKTISKGTTPSTIGSETTEEGVIRFLRAENLYENKITLTPTFYIDQETDDVLFRSRLETNDVLSLLSR